MFSAPVDICNRALQHLGARRISTLADNSVQAVECSFAYDKLRQAELRAHVWRFSARKAALRSTANATNVLTFGNYVSTTSYVQGDVINDNTVNVGNSGTAYYISLVGSNSGNTPSSSPTKWTPYFGPLAAETYSSAHTYSTGEIVLYSGSYYLSLVNSNINNTPTGGAPNWSASLTSPTATTLFIPYPATQFSSGTTRTAYMLPFGYLRVAPQDPKAAGIAWQTVSAGMAASDFQFEGNLLLTSYAPNVATLGPLVLRFCADISDVTMMDPQFCESLAIRLAFDLSERITQKTELKKELSERYGNIIASAWRDNLLEQGSTDPEELQYMNASLLGTGLLPGGGGGAQGGGR